MCILLQHKKSEYVGVYIDCELVFAFSKSDETVSCTECLWVSLLRNIKTVKMLLSTWISVCTTYDNSLSSPFLRAKTATAFSASRKPWLKFLAKRFEKMLEIMFGQISRKAKYADASSV